MSNENQKPIELTFTEVKAGGGGSYPQFDVWNPKKGSHQVIFGLLVQAKKEFKSVYSSSPFTLVCPTNPAIGITEDIIYTIWAREGTPLYDSLCNCNVGEFIQIKYTGTKPNKAGTRNYDTYYVGKAGQELPEVKKMMEDFFKAKVLEHQAKSKAADGAATGNADAEEPLPF